MKRTEQRFAPSTAVAGVCPSLAACGQEWATATKFWLLPSASYGLMLPCSSIGEGEC